MKIKLIKGDLFSSYDEYSGCTITLKYEPLYDGKNCVVDTDKPHLITRIVRDGKEIFNSNPTKDC